MVIYSETFSADGDLVIHRPEPEPWEVDINALLCERLHDPEQPMMKEHTILRVTRKPVEGWIIKTCPTNG